MRLILVTGGVRSGKSRHAERLATELGGDAVTYVATATAGDAEMAAKIARHRADRPEAWRTIEAARDAAAAVRAAETDVVLLDCLTVLASNAILAMEEDGREAVHAAVAAEVEALVHAVHAREGVAIVVTNEVGLGVVPHTELGRWFRDALGEANQRVAAVADEVHLLVSGLPIRIKPAG